MLRHRITKLENGRALSPYLRGPELYQVLAWMQFSRAKPGEWIDHMIFNAAVARGMYMACYDRDGSMLGIKVTCLHEPN